MLRNPVALSLLMVLAHAADSMAVQEISVNNLTIAPGATDTLVVSGNVDAPNFGVTIVVVLSPQGGNTGTLTFTPGPADIAQLAHPWATTGTLTIFDVDDLGLPSENFYSDGNADTLNESITFNGAIAGFPVVASGDASGVWDVSLSSVNFGLDSFWNAEPPIVTTRIAGTVTIETGCPDADADGVCDAADNCPNDFNPSQDDTNGNGVGDACDACLILGDIDGSGFVDGGDIDGYLRVILAAPEAGDNVACALYGTLDIAQDTALFVDDLLGVLPLGACCFGDGSCQDGVTVNECTALGGDGFRGVGTDCASTTCPVNDKCDNAISLSGATGGEGVFAFDNTGATRDGLFHTTCDGTQIDADIWFCWQAVCNGFVQLDTCGQTAVDTKIAVYDVCDGRLASPPLSVCTPSNTSLLACDDNACGLQSSVLFSAVAGQSYLIRLGTSPGQPGGTGTFTIACLGNVLGGDACVDALAIAGDGTFDFNTLGATTDGLADAACDFFAQNQIENDVWFCWTASCTGTTTVQTCGTTLDTKLAAYDGCTCPAAAPLDCNDDSDACGANSRQSSISFPTVGGNTYLLRVGSFSAADTGSGTLTIACTP